MRLNDIEITMFPAGSGDSILISFLNENFKILIDGGYGETYDRHLKPFLSEMGRKGERLNLIIATHIDRDHINGIKKLLMENGKAQCPQIIPIDEIWFNGFRSMPITIGDCEDIPIPIAWVLQKMASNNQENADCGIQDISFRDGDSLAELISLNGYSWNAPFLKAVAVDDRTYVEYGKIRISILNPTLDDLNKLAHRWINELKRSTKKEFVITDNHLFDRAFEGCFIYDCESETGHENISFHDSTATDWKSEAEKKDDKPDRSLQNLSSIAILIEYDGKTLLFAGDCPMHKIIDLLPNEIDIVKLPHHGSGKSNLKRFIREWCVNYYLVSTDGNHGHPSKMIMGNILCCAKERPVIVTNYHLPMLEGVSIMGEDVIIDG